MTGPASTSVIRQWARDQGIVVGERGRLSPQVLSAYATSVPSPAHSPKPVMAVPAPRRTRGALRIPVQPAPGATGIRHRIVARHS